MNRRLGFLISMGAGIVLLAGAAGAQDRSDVSDRTAPNVLKGDTYVGAQVGVDFIGDTNFKCRCESRQSDFLLYGGRLGHFFTDHLALEGTYHWVDLHPGFYDATLGLMWDFTPSIPGWNTYVGIGGGKEHVYGEGEGLAYLSFGSEYRFNRVVGARFELRGQHVFDEPFIGGSAHNDVQPTVGVVIHFGAPAPAPPPPPPAPEMPKPSPPPAAPPPPPMAASAPPAEEPPPPVVAPAPAPETATNEIPFDRNSTRISNIAKAVLDRVAARLKDDLHATVVITGYADEGTPERRRDRLAADRAEHAKEYLVTRHGIDAARISTRTDSTTPATAGKATVVVTFSPRS